MTLPIMPLLNEAELDRTTLRPYNGPINVGDIFAWEPDLPHARCLTVVSRIGSSSPPSVIKPTGIAYIGKGSDNIIHSWDFPDRQKEVWNDESRFREAVIPTRLKPQPPNPQTDEQIAEMIARARTPLGQSWIPLRDDILTLLKGHPYPDYPPE